jgi:hypothetical protein
VFAAWAASARRLARSTKCVATPPLSSDGAPARANNQRRTPAKCSSWAARRPAGPGSAVVVWKRAFRPVGVRHEHLAHRRDQLVVLDIVGDVPDQVDRAEGQGSRRGATGCLQLLEFVQRKDMRGEEIIVVVGPVLTLDHRRTPPEQRRHEANGKREELVRCLDMQANWLEGPHGGDDVVADRHGALAVGNVGDFEGEGQGIGLRIEVKFLLGGRCIGNVNDATC